MVAYPGRTAALDPTYTGRMICAGQPDQSSGAAVMSIWRAWVGRLKPRRGGADMAILEALEV